MGETLPEVIEPAQPATLFHTNDPDEVVAAAAAMAQSLASVIDRQDLYVTISGRRHVRVEGWTLLGTMLGVFPVCVATAPVGNGWQATVEARTRAGEVVGCAVAICTRDEATWRDRPEYALLSMAQTRATSKALRQPLGFVVSLAGYDATPAEEMPVDDSEPFRVGDGNYRMEGSGVRALATDRQVKAMHALITRLGKLDDYDQDALHEQVLSTYGAASLKDLTREQASAVIDGLARQVPA
jgi:hypothetical protein